MQVKAKIEALDKQIEYAELREKFQGMIGGFGSGKSQGAVFRTLSLMKSRKKCVMLQVAPTYSLLADVNIPDYEETLQRYRIPYEYKKQERKISVNHGVLNGEIWFRSADRPERIVGFDITDFQIDEYDILPTEKQKELWRKIIARARGCNDATGGVTTTPEGFRQTYELFEKKKIGPLIRAKTTDNPFLPDDYIEMLYEQYDEMLVKQYINAEFVNINGLQAYYGFSRTKNNLTNEDFEKEYQFSLDELSEINIGMDFNVHKMCAEIFVHLDELGRIHFFDEIALKHPGYSAVPQTQVMADIIKERYPNKQVNVYPDATARHRETSATKSDIAILENNGFRVYANNQNPSVRDRLTSANNMLGKKQVTIDTDRCPELTEDFEKCERDKYGELDKQDIDRTHASDAGTYPIVYLYNVGSYKSYSRAI